MNKISLKTSLFDYQVDCANKFKKLKVGALFMDMGTGKTRTMLEIIKDKFENGKIEKVVWLCPFSARKNIRKEIEKHVDEGKEYFIISGIESLSTSVSLNSFLDEYTKKYKCILVVDESIKIKNHNALRSQHINLIARNCEYRFILNGTAISKDETDLFNQFYFLDWRILGYRSYYSFKNRYVKESVNIRKNAYEVINVKEITDKISPYVFQAKKEDVLDLKSKRYIKQYFELSDSQLMNLEEFEFDFIERANELNITDIYLLLTGVKLITSGYKVAFKNKKLVKQKMFDDAKDNPRIKSLLKCVTDEKTIIFCNYIDELKDVSEVLSKRYGEDSVVKYYGSMTLTERHESIEKFADTASYFVAIKSCAGYSLNLQFCSNVIYYSNDWDYATRSQSEDRIHRVGQEYVSTYTDIIASNTLDENIVRCLQKKESLARNVSNSLLKKQRKMLMERSAL